MNPKDKLDLIRAIEEKETTRRRRGDWLAWGSVILAAVVLALMIAAARWTLKTTQTEVANTQAELRKQQAALEVVNTSLKAKEAELDEKSKQAVGLQRFLETLPQAQRTSLVDKTLKQNPDTANLLPLVYMQIVVRKDRPLAEEIAAKLRSAGFFVPGIECVENSQAFRNIEVRYYKQRDTATAEKIVDVLKQAGQVDASPEHLERYENDPKALPNHFEVWLPRRDEPDTQDSGTNLNSKCLQ